MGVCTSISEAKTEMFPTIGFESPAELQIRVHRYLFDFNMKLPDPLIPYVVGLLCVYLWQSPKFYREILQHCWLKIDWYVSSCWKDCLRHQNLSLWSNWRILANLYEQSITSNFYYYGTFILLFFPFLRSFFR